ncbi:MAG: acetyl-CoA acetyltransferase [Chloroflexi bacterium]|nr:acetyl-CoA acetyltransferase [Chloroflexota bacterium]
MGVSIVGAGMIPVREHWSRGLAELAAEAGDIALKDAGLTRVDALYVGNAYGAAFNQQTQLGSLLAGSLGLQGAEAYTCEAGDASGGVALRTGYLAVASGAVRSAMVLGVEKATDIVGSARISARNVSLDADYESINGATLTAMAGLLMRRYMHEFGVDLAQFEGFSINAHENGSRNQFAMYRNRLRSGAFTKAPMIADPVSLFDSAPDGDGAAAVLLVNSEFAADLAPNPVTIAGSAIATDSLTLQDRADLLYLKAVAESTAQCLEQAGIEFFDLDALELHDAYTVLTALSLESMGFSERGHGCTWSGDDGARIAPNGELPISTFGGLKSRGNPGGASGIYQAVEAVRQLTGRAGDNQVQGARHILTQCIGGLGATVATHILSAPAD